MIVRRKLNSIEGKISEALINNEVSHKDYKGIINEESDFKKLKESIRMMISQRSDTSLIEQGKKQALMKCSNAIKLWITFLNPQCHIIV